MQLYGEHHYGSPPFSAHYGSLPSINSLTGMQEFNGEEFLECIKDLVRIDREWVPSPTEKIKHPSLYIRPTFIGTEVG